MITVYLKPTNFCNVGCAHCYLTEQVRADRLRMDEPTLEKSALMLEQMRVAQRKSKVHIIWHGGEPLVLPASYFWKAGETLDRLMPGHSESLQTSLIPLREDHLDWIQARLGNAIGSSMDFSARVTKDGPEGYQKLWMSKVEKCRARGIEVIPGVTPSTPEIKRAGAITQWMAERGFTRYNIEKYNAYKFDAPDHPSNREHADFLWDLFLDMMTREMEGRAAPIVRVVAAAIGGILHGQPGDRWGGSCQSDFVVIEPNGSLNNCPDKSSKEPGYSNVSQGFEGFAKSPMRRKWIRLQAVGHRNSDCASCENSSWCKSGCPITCNQPELENNECAGYKSFITRAREFMGSAQGLAAAQSYLARARTAPAGYDDGYEGAK